MKHRHRTLTLALLLILMLAGCKVTLIGGYNQVVDDNATRMQKEFNVNASKLARALSTTDRNTDQSFANFQPYYDQLNADTITLRSYSLLLGKKSDIARKQIDDLLATLRKFEIAHHNGLLTDGTTAAFMTSVDAVNNAFTGLIFLQEKLKAVKP